MAMFISPYASLTVVVRNSRKLLSKDGEVVVVPGKKAEFHRGQYETQDQEIIDYLRKHKDYGIMFNGVAENGTPEVEEKVSKEKTNKKKQEEKALAHATEAEETNKKIDKQLVE